MDRRGLIKSAFCALAAFLASVEIAEAQSIDLGIGITSIPVVKKQASSLSPFSLAYVGTAADLTFQTTFTYTSQGLGAAVAGSNKRYTIVAVAAVNGSGQLVTAVTVGGLSATKVIDSAAATPGVAAIWIVDTSSLGTTATVTVAVNGGGGTGCSIGLYRMVNPGSSTASATATAANAAGVSTATITVPSGGFGIAVVQVNNSGAGAVTTTWTGTSTPTKNWDAVDGSAISKISSGAINTVTGASRTFIATQSDPGNIINQNIAAASWGP